ncbi:LOW QUALITY PROTEIN: hypothetical protein AAY473_006934 [Plecturocebus cupreus]
MPQPAGAVGHDQASSALASPGETEGKQTQPQATQSLPTRDRPPQGQAATGQQQKQRRKHQTGLRESSQTVVFQGTETILFQNLPVWYPLGFLLLMSVSEMPEVSHTEARARPSATLGIKALQGSLPAELVQLLASSRNSFYGNVLPLPVSKSAEYTSWPSIPKSNKKGKDESSTSLGFYVVVDPAGLQLLFILKPKQIQINKNSLEVNTN